MRRRLLGHMPVWKRWSLGLAVAFWTTGPTPALAACNSRLFTRGDADCDGQVRLTDGLRILNFLFARAALPCLDAADANDDGKINITDPVRILLGLFAGLGPLPAPYPQPGSDPTPDKISCVGATLCTGSFRVERIGILHRLRQPSGIAPSLQFPDVLWVVQDADSGRDPQLYACRHSGPVIAAIRLCVNAEECSLTRDLNINTDWEALAVGARADGSEVLYIGDLGNNRTVIKRSRLWIHRVPVRDPRTHPSRITLFREAGDFDTLFVDYPGAEPRDAEVLLRDPRHGTLYLMDVTGLLFRYPGEERPGQTVVLEPAGAIGLSFVDTAWPSGGDVTPDGRLMVLKALSEVWFFPWNSGEPASPLDGAPCKVDLSNYVQGGWHAGAVAFDSNSSLISLEENQGTPIFRMTFPAERVPLLGQAGARE